MADPLQVALRLKAARWLAGAANERGKPRALSTSELAGTTPLIENRIRQNRLEEIEQMETEARRMELGVIAEALGLPTNWFTAPDRELRLRLGELFEQELQEGADTSRRRDDDTGLGEPGQEGGGPGR